MFWRKFFPLLTLAALLPAAGASANEAQSSRESELLRLAIRDRARELDREMADGSASPEKRLRPLVRRLQKDFGAQNRSHIAAALADVFPELHESILRELLRDRVSDSQALVDALGPMPGRTQGGVANLPGRVIASHLSRAHSTPARRLTLPTASGHRRHVSTQGEPSTPTVVSGAGTGPNGPFELGVATRNGDSNLYTIQIGEAIFEDCMLTGGVVIGDSIAYTFSCGDDPNTVEIEIVCPN